MLSASLLFLILDLVLESQPPDNRLKGLLATDAGSITFAVTQNLHIRVGIHGKKTVWYFISHGLYTVGQEEVCLLLRRRDGEDLPPIDAFWHFFCLYDLAFSTRHFIGEGELNRPGDGFFLKNITNYLVVA